MSKSLKVIVLAGVLLVAIGAAIYVVVFDKKETASTDTTNSSQGTNGNIATEQQKTEGTTSPNTNQEVAATITYSNNGFSPTEISVEANQTIKIVNQSSAILDFSSDPHPTHTNNPELNVGDVSPGESATFTISKTGNWGYHNHHAPNHHGTIIVK